MQTASPSIGFIQQARRGILRRRVDEVAKLVGLTDKEMAYALAMSVRSLHGKAPHEPLSLSAGERLLLLEQLLRHGLAVFDGRADLLSRWLRTPLDELAYRTGSDTSDAETTMPLSTLGSFHEPFVAYVPTAQPPSTDGLVPQSPLAVLDTVSGFMLADDVLGRIEWGLVG
ncbi:antitoxin Xre-like helix-turn-helix domain-containing protein [Fibrella sp. WM1]|uniref:antitoxin Xre-like helix-turn-helix domain-containing protein n=1 Tax=Fibrella musci TaxID=3242485 RepID=UPI0035222595